MQNVENTEGKKKQYAVIVVLFVFLFLVYGIYFYLKPLESSEVGVRFIVGEPPGFDLDSSEIVFGRVPPQGTATRNLVLTNNYDFPVKIDLFSSKEILPYITAKTPVFLEPKANVSISVSVFIPSDLPYGNYSGKILVETRRK